MENAGSKFCFSFFFSLCFYLQVDDHYTQKDCNCIRTMSVLDSCSPGEGTHVVFRCKASIKLDEQKSCWSKVDRFLVVGI